MHMTVMTTFYEIASDLKTLHGLFYKKNTIYTFPMYHNPFLTPTCCAFFIVPYSLCTRIRMTPLVATSGNTVIREWTSHCAIRWKKGKFKVLLREVFE